MYTTQFRQNKYKPVELGRVLLKLSKEALVESFKQDKASKYLSKNVHVAFELIPLTLDGKESSEDVKVALEVAEMLLSVYEKLSKKDREFIL